MVSFILNGSEVSVADDHPHLLAALREELGVCSPKDGCSPSGQCGCCTVLVDGKAVVSCNLSRAEGRGRGDHDARGPARRRARPHGVRVRGDRRVAVRLLHAGHPRAGRVAARTQGRRSRPRHRGPPPRRAPLPVHGLREDPRRGRAARQGRDAARSNRSAASARAAAATRASISRSATSRTSTTCARRGCCTARCGSPITRAPTCCASTRARPRRCPVSCACSPRPTSPASCASG